MTLAALCQAADGYTLSWNGTVAALTAEDLELTATPGALYVEVNGRALYVEHGVQVRDGRIALPLEVLAEAAGLQLTWDEVEGAAWLSTDQAQPASASYPAEDLYWLSRIISAESRGEPLLGQIAVGNVILNRVESSQYPDTVEGVVFDTKYGVQFQPVSNGRINSVKVTAETIRCVDRALDGEDYSNGALYFMNRKASGRKAGWFDSRLTYLFAHGGHEFFK